MNTAGPQTEKHLLRLSEAKALSTDQERADYIERVRNTEGPFYARWLRDDLIVWHREKKGGKA